MVLLDKVVVVRQNLEINLTLAFVDSVVVELVAHFEEQRAYDLSLIQVMSLERDFGMVMLQALLAV